MFSSKQLFRGNKIKTILNLKSYSNMLVDLLECKIGEHRQLVDKIKKEYGKTVVGNVTVNHLYSGMRGMLGFVCETSDLDPLSGITFRGHSLEDIEKQLPRFNDKSFEPMPEGIFWLLLTDDIPTRDEVKFITDEWNARSELPNYAVNVLKSLPKDLHPMSQLAICIQSLQNESKFKANRNNVDKNDYWKLILEDAMNLLGKLPTIAARVYNDTFKNGKGCYEIDCDLDWSANYSRMMGYTDPNFDELMRLYLTIHADHGGGNVSAHVAHIVGSAHADPYIAFASGLNGLAGPLHGLANQEVLEWLDELVKSKGENPSDDDIIHFVKNRKIQIIPGYGHAVLRVADPRFIFQQKFAQRVMPDDPMVKLVSQVYKIIPDYLKSLKKVQNPYPNVDAHSGVLLRHFCLTESNYYTVLFGISRCIGILTQAVWARAMRVPISRPDSTSTKYLMKILQKKKNQAKAK